MKTALQLSGGRDSLATLFHLEDEWEDMTVAWCDGGDSAAELRLLMAKVADTVPHFARVQGLAPYVRELWGDPTPGNWMPCCNRSIWMPMMQWVLENRFTHLVRGTRRCDPHPTPAPGDEIFGVKFINPIWAWDDDELQDALDTIALRGFKAVYPHDCLHCPVERVCDRPELRNVKETLKC